MIQHINWTATRTAYATGGCFIIGISIVYRFYNSIRWSADPKHATAWMAVQTSATILAFVAAGIYAGIAYRHTKASIRQTAAVIRQADASDRQAVLEEKDYIERNKPLVLLDRWKHPDKANNYHMSYEMSGWWVRP